MIIFQTPDFACTSVCLTQRIDTQTIPWKFSSDQTSCKHQIKSFECGSKIKRSAISILNFTSNEQVEAVVG